MRSNFNPFARVVNTSSAQVGRWSDNPTILARLARLHAKHQGGSDGYDRGGAYWGYPSDVWAVWGRVDGAVLCVYVRAASRDAAIEEVRNG